MSKKLEDYGPTNPARTMADVRERVRFYDVNNVWEWASVSEVLGWTQEEYDEYCNKGKLPERVLNELPKM